MTDLNLRKIPVFVFPTTLKFYLSSRSTHKQLLTLYNPYDFPVRFKVLCTTPNKYSVIDPEGSIGPRSCVDIVIRHNMLVAANCNVTDKFRISMQDHTTKQILGKRDLEAVLLQSEKECSIEGDNFQSLPYSDRSTSNIDDQHSIYYNRRTFPATSTNVIAILTGIVCMVGLLLPTLQEAPVTSSVPTYLHISVSLKLVFAYALGLVSMVLFKVN